MTKATETAALRDVVAWYQAHMILHDQEIMELRRIKSDAPEDAAFIHDMKINTLLRFRSTLEGLAEHTQQRIVALAQS